jgi:hypothetical protein
MANLSLCHIILALVSQSYLLQQVSALIHIFVLLSNSSYSKIRVYTPQLLSSPAQLKQYLTSQQCLKLLLHEHCNYRSRKTINHWIWSGYLNIDPSIANSLDPICITCQYGKAHRKQHNTGKGSITNSHTKPGDGISANQMEANYPGKLPATKGLPTHK